MTIGEKNDAILEDRNKELLHAAYRQHTAALRTWLVAFGVGAPVFMGSSDDRWNKFVHAPNVRCLGSLFLIGVMIQIVSAGLDKYFDLFCLSRCLGIRDTTDLPARMGLWWMRNDWVSIIADLLTVALFGLAGYNLLAILTS